MEQYERWLKVLFFLLAPPSYDRRTLLDQTIQGLFDSHAALVAVHVNRKTPAQRHCLLSDRGHVEIPSPAGGYGVAFNVNRHAFVTYNFLDLYGSPDYQVSKEVLDIYMAERRTQVMFIGDDDDHLANYNQRAVYYSHRHVFCSSPAPFGCEVR